MRPVKEESAAARPQPAPAVRSSEPTIALPAQIVFGLMLVFLSLATLVPAIRGELAVALGWLTEAR